ncbi:CAMK family protein kinase-like protein [Leptotrombidium deliense]|uniref:CAMK family protein kinase-like protein n=1 Tax=Leptotrombidium deliense TaxID=299467 RepID=A0A443SAM2_9ACAR|nr:CAMK family protein kinase-like protein [Leptotrombidium deliense]
MSAFTRLTRVARFILYSVSIVSSEHESELKINLRMAKVETATSQLKIMGLDGMYYPDQIAQREVYTAPKVESLVEPKQSKQEQEVRDWVRARSEIDSKDKSKSGVLKKFKGKASKSYDEMMITANNILKKVKNKVSMTDKNDNENERDTIDLKVMSKPMSRLIVQLSIDDSSAAEIRKEVAKRIATEEEQIRSDFEMIYKNNRKMEREMAAKSQRDERLRKQLIVKYETFEKKIVSDIEYIEKRLNFLKDQKLDEKGKREFKNLEQRLQTKQAELEELKKQRDEHVKQNESNSNERKMKDGDTMNDYFFSENVLKEMLVRRIVIRRTLETHSDLKSEKRGISLSEQKRGPKGSESRHHWHKQEMDSRMLSDSDRRKLQSYASDVMRSNVCIMKDIPKEEDIEQITGFEIKGKISDYTYGVSHRAKNNLPGKEKHDYSVTVVDYKLTNHDLEVQLRKNGFRVVQYVMDHSFKRLVSIHGLFQVANAKVFIFEEYCTENLYEKLNKNGPMNEVDTRHVMVSVMEAVNFLHNIGVAHQNVNPCCIVFNRHGHVKLGEIMWSAICWNGLKQKVNKQVGLRKQKGSTYAPELSSSNTYDPMKADVYSCGAVACFALLKKYPFSHKCAFDFDRQMVMFQTELKKVCSDLCLSFITSCLVKDPETRLGMNKLVNHLWFAAKMK